MRFHLISDSKEESIIDLVKTHVHSSELVEFEFKLPKINKNIQCLHKVYIRKLGGGLFASLDGVSWNKIAKQDWHQTISNVDKLLTVYRGFKPSGIKGINEGELRTQMPGKVINISVKKNEKVSKGQILLILESMKMENEIKSKTCGIVKAVHVKDGDILEEGFLMIEIEETNEN